MIIPKARTTAVEIATVMPMLGPRFSMSVKKIPKSDSSTHKAFTSF